MWNYLMKFHSRTMTRFFLYVRFIDWWLIFLWDCFSCMRNILILFFWFAFDSSSFDFWLHFLILLIILFSLILLNKLIIFLFLLFLLLLVNLILVFNLFHLILFDNFGLFSFILLGLVDILRLTLFFKNEFILVVSLVSYFFTRRLLLRSVFDLNRLIFIATLLLL